MSTVTIKNLVKSYDEAHIIKGVDIDIEDGEFVILVGPSGCGKSTLLRMIAGLEDITDGEIYIGDRLINDVPPKERDIAMVFQTYALYPHMTVEENMSFSLRLKKASKSEIKEKVEHAAEILGLKPLLDRLPKQLSGGQRQRVAMGRAIVRNPKVFLFDEPLSNLDAKLRVLMRTEIKALHQRLKTTIIYVTHDQVEAMTMADKIVVLNGGNIEQIGAPLELYDRPKNLFVAGFIGSPAMNLIQGEVKGGEFVTDTGIQLSLPDEYKQRNQKVTLGIRPEHFVLDDAGFECCIDVIEPTGSEVLVMANVKGSKLSLLFRDRIDISVNQVIKIKPVLENIHLFDSESGLRIN